MSAIGTIDTSKLLTVIRNQFVYIMSLDTNFYGKYHIVLSNEQQFIENKEREPETIYIVVKFMNASLNYGQSVLPININAIAEQNKIDCCQRLLLDFAQQWNLKDPKTTDATGQTNVDFGTSFVKQVYATPYVMNNFSEQQTGFRSLFYMSGTFLIGANSNPISSITADDVLINNVPYELKFLTANFNYSINLDPQAFYTTTNNTRSIGTTATTTLGVSAYLTNDLFFKKVMDIAFRNYNATTGQPNNINTTFMLTIKLKNNMQLTGIPFKLGDINLKQNVGELPQIQLTFTN